MLTNLHAANVGAGITTIATVDELDVLPGDVQGPRAAAGSRDMSAPQTHAGQPTHTQVGTLPLQLAPASAPAPAPAHASQQPAATTQTEAAPQRTMQPTPPRTPAGTATAPPVDPAAAPYTPPLLAKSNSALQQVIRQTVTSVLLPWEAPLAQKDGGAFLSELCGIAPVIKYLALHTLAAMGAQSAGHPLPPDMAGPMAWDKASS